MATTFKVSEVGKTDRQGYYKPEGYFKPELIELEAALNRLAKNRGYVRPEARGGSAEKVLTFSQADGLFGKMLCWDLT